MYTTLMTASTTVIVFTVVICSSTIVIVVNFNYRPALIHTRTDTDTYTDTDNTDTDNTHTDTQTYNNIMWNISSCKVGNAIMLMVQPYPTQSANSMAFGTVADNSIIPMWSGSIINTSSHTTPL